MRSTAATRTLTGQATPGATRRTTAGAARTTAAGVSRPSLADVPGREKKDSRAPSAAVGGGGWAGYKKAREERSAKYPRFEVDTAGERYLIRFAEAEPFAFIYRHWVDKRPYTCIADPDNDVTCPLCEANHKAKPVVFYNVITVDDTTLRVWEMTNDPTKQVQKQYDKAVGIGKTLDDPGYYFVVSKSKADNGFFEYDVERVKTDDLAEETGQDPLGDDEIDEALRKGLFTDDIVYVSDRDALQEAAGKLSDTD